MLIGQQLGPFVIEKELGSGAMGTVYRASFNKDEKTIPVALKVIALGLAGNEGATARFEREADILKQLRHPHIVRLIATGRYRKTRFITMEYIDGEALDRTLSRRGRMSWEEVATLGKQLADALQYAHEKGIIHRDLKPSNLMITREGILKLTDFGIAKDTDVTALTGMNSTIGTAAYMSPEQCKGDKNLTHKSDLYSLGIVFFELLTGRKPFTAESTVDMFLKHVNESPPRIGKLVQDLPPKMEALILQLLEKDKNDRPMDASWVARMLGEIEEDAYTRKSAGLDAATARKIDRPRKSDDRPIDESDREAARSLRQTKRKKKKKPNGPWYERKWVKATALIGLLVAIAVTVYLATRPPSAERLARVIEDAKTPDARLQAAEAYLRIYGETSGENTERASAVYREEKVLEREKQLNNRFGSEKLRENPENDDPDAYRDAMLAIRAEKSGSLKLATDLWRKVGNRFQEEGKLPYTFDETTLVKARWGWIAERRIREIESVAVRNKQLEAKIDESRRDEKIIPFSLTSPEALAMRAIRLERIKDFDKASKFWDSLIALTEKDFPQHEWFLLGAEHRTNLPKEPLEGALEHRKQWVTEKIRDLELRFKSLATSQNPVGDRIYIRSQCREVIDLYEDEVEKQISDAVAQAKQILAGASKS